MLNIFIRKDFVSKVIISVMPTLELSLISKIISFTYSTKVEFAPMGNKSLWKIVCRFLDW